MNRDRGVPLTTASLLSAGTRLRIPDLFYYQGKRFTSAAMKEIRETNRHLSSSGFLHFSDQGLFKPLLFVKEENLCEPRERGDHKRILLHEFGHVAEFLVLGDRGCGAHHMEAMGQIRTRALSNPAGLLPDYSTIHPAEEYADGFEAYHTARRTPGTSAEQNNADFEDLSARNVPLMKLIEEDLAHCAG